MLLSQNWTQKGLPAPALDCDVLRRCWGCFGPCVSEPPVFGVAVEKQLFILPFFGDLRLFCRGRWRRGGTASLLSPLSVRYRLLWFVVPGREKSRHGLCTGRQGMSPCSRSDSGGKEPHQNREHFGTEGALLGRQWMAEAVSALRTWKFYVQDPGLVLQLGHLRSSLHLAGPSEIWMTRLPGFTHLSFLDWSRSVGLLTLDFKVGVSGILPSSGFIEIFLLACPGGE